MVPSQPHLLNNAGRRANPASSNLHSTPRSDQRSSVEGCLKSDAPALPRLPSETPPLGSAISDLLVDPYGS